MTQKITVIDTGSANLTSVVFAFNRLGVKTEISQDADVIRSSDKLILPGVGTASAAMALLKERKLDTLIPTLEQPVLGICLGMQMLGKESQENMANSTQVVPCLNITKGAVKLLKSQGLTLPHMGWNQVFQKKDSPLFKNIPNRAYFYFVHSYALEITEDTLATSEYGEQFTSVVQHNNFYGTQFHPEKSGALGAQLLRNFLDI